jgi:hypothetical protein
VAGMREQMIEDWIIETAFVVRGREGEKGVLATSEFVDRGSVHVTKSTAPCAVSLGHPSVQLTHLRADGGAGS